MKAEIIAVGTELLLGDIVNTNAAYLARELSLMGIDCYRQTVVGDNNGRLKSAVEEAFKRCDIIITSGGLGPTYDDLTKETVANYFGLKTALHKPSYEMLMERFQQFKATMTENNKKQAIMPIGAIVFSNDRGTANGLAVEQDGKIAIMLPGPPRELTAMFQNSVKPYLLGKSDHVLVSHNIHLFGIGESQLESELHNLMLSTQNPTVAPYAKEGEILVRVTASGSTKAEAETLLEPMVEQIVRKYPQQVYGVDVGSLEQAVVKALTRGGQTVATAESCTGGLVSERLTAVNGASQVFGYGVCTYANKAKIKVLGVREETLAAHGAVSEETALEMAKGVRELSGADFGVSVTGIAGPSGGTKEKPVGTVYIALSWKDGEEVKRLDLDRGYGGGREHIRRLASSNVLNLLLKKTQANREK